MKPSAQSDFQVSIYREVDQWRDMDVATHHLYEDIYALQLNHWVSLYLIPQFDIADMSHEVLKGGWGEVSSISQARAQTAVGASTVITPDATRAGEDAVVQIANVQQLESDESWERETTFLYVSPDDYAELDAEIAGVFDRAETLDGPDGVSKFPLEESLLVRLHGPKISEIEDLLIAKFIKSRLMKSPLVDTSMLQDPEVSGT